MKYASAFNPAVTPQSEQADPAQVKNNAGGYAFTIDPWQHLDRFLILGTEGGTYYVGERDHTKQGAQCAFKLLTASEADAIRVIDRVVEISDSGRAIKNDPALYVLALASAQSPFVRARQHANAMLPKVARTGTHLFTWAEARQALNGWSRGSRRAVANWYTKKEVNSAAFQMVKYRQRNGWSHRDLLRLAHPTSASHAALFDKVCHADKEVAGLPRVFEGYLKAAKAEKPDPGLIREYALTWEMVPTEWLNSVPVWQALLEKMPLMALVRNLPKLTDIGILKPLADESLATVARLTDQEEARKARIHPFQALVALKTYASGKGFRGSLAWTAVPEIVQALEALFYLTFHTAPRTGKKWLLGCDVSASMSSAIANTNVACCEATAALAMTVLRTEPGSYAMAFDQGFRDLKIRAGTALEDAVAKTRNINGGGTDCALPMIYALVNNLEVDAFVVLTDNETWAGNVHPHQALAMYRKQMQRPHAKLIVVGMTATRFTIANPADPGMLDVVGMDPTVPQAMQAFVTG